MLYGTGLCVLATYVLLCKKYLCALFVMQCDTFNTLSINYRKYMYLVLSAVEVISRVLPF